MTTHHADRWFQDALAALDAYEPDRARELLERLENVGDARAVEVLARVLVAEFDPEGAIDALRAWVRAHPASWRGWELLGRILADRGRRVEADEAFRAGEACPDCWLGSIRYNRAVLALNAGRPDDARALLDAVEDYGDPVLAALATEATLRAHREVRADMLVPAPVFEVTLELEIDGVRARQVLTGYARHAADVARHAAVDLDARYGTARSVQQRMLRVDASGWAGIVAVSEPVVVG